MLYAPLSAAVASCSSVATALVVAKFLRDWQLRASSVQWLFAVFFAYLLAHTLARVAYYAWLSALLSSPDARSILRSDASERFSLAELDRLGILALPYLHASRNGLLVLVAALGDVALFGASVWVLALTVELSKVLAATMDRGGGRERAKIHRYAWAGHALVAAFAAAEAALAAASGGYSSGAHALLLSVYGLQIASLAFMAAALAALKLQGRDVESLHGRFVASPLYRRLKCIMVVYALFALEFQVGSLVLYLSPRHDARVLEYLGVSVVLFMSTGLVLALVTGCSLPCFLRVCPCAVPPEMRERMTILHDDAALADAGVAPAMATLDTVGPWVNPVFVFTDIESSSALWAVGDGHVMQQAVQVHDDVLRGALATHRGYEIATAGDAFQLAFHTIREAAEYCLEVQLQLLAADWPRELHGLVPAANKERQAHRCLFRGLRVRMGIHDAAESEGRLVVDAHAVTGKTTYTGTSQAVASTVGDLGAGGQIVVTRRVAAWLTQHRELVAERFELERLGELVVPHVNVHVELFQLLPSQLRAVHEWRDGLQQHAAPSVHVPH